MGGANLRVAYDHVKTFLIRAQPSAIGGKSYLREEASFLSIFVCILPRHGESES
jgi:hypothetical protein